MKMSRSCDFGPYRLDFARRLLLRGGEPVALQQKALEILIVLVQHGGEVVSKDELMKAVWPDAFVEESNLSQNIFVLRKALGERAQENRYIATIPGRGYSFVAQIEEEVIEASSHPEADSALTHRAGDISGKSNRAKRTSGGKSHPKSPLAQIAMLAVAGVAVVFGLATILPRLARYYNNRGVVRQQNGNIKGAIDDYRWALRFSPGYTEARYNLGDSYEDIPDYDEALRQYQRVIDADPTFYPAYNNLSRLYILRQKDYGAALRLLDRAFSLHPQEPSVQYTLYKNYGWANFGLGHMGQAEQNLRSAVRLDPHRGSAHCLLAKVLVEQARATDAIPEWRSCLAYSNEPEVEPEWRDDARENLKSAQKHLMGNLK